MNLLTEACMPIYHLHELMHRNIRYFLLYFRYTHLDLEESSDCLFDFVEFFDGSQINNATSMGKFCGTIVPSNQMSTTSRFLVVRFYSDRSTNKGGFRIILTASLGMFSLSVFVFVTTAFL